MKVVALLPMKAHSSRVPGKNFKPLAGKPLFRWILGELLDADFVERIVINTDAEAELERCGLVSGGKVEIKRRRPELIGDDVNMNLIIEDDLYTTGAEYFVMTHSTNPALTRSTLEAAYCKYVEVSETGFDSLFSVNRFQKRFYHADGTPINHDPSCLVPTQDLEAWYEENSCFYFFSRASFLNTRARIGEKPFMFGTPRMESIDIDEWDDWNLAELVMSAKSQ